MPKDKDHSLAQLPCMQQRQQQDINITVVYGMIALINLTRLRGKTQQPADTVNLKYVFINYMSCFKH